MKSVICSLIILLSAGMAAACGTARGSGNKATPNSATSDEWRGQPAGRAEELFVGRFPGVQVFQVAGGISVQIRGANTISGDTEPLYVIDDMPIEPGPGGALMGINPADIEKIEVLKDAGSTGMYGSRGANGVILIRMKRAGVRK